MSQKNSKSHVHFLMVAVCFIVMAVSSAARADDTSEDQEISQINGQLVPVGEHNKYVFNHYTWNISTNPLAYSYGTFSLGVSHSMGSVVALRMDADYYAPFATGISGAGASIGLPIYFKKMYDGFFLELGARVFSGKQKDTDTSVLFYGPQALIGWHWIWDNGLNIALAVGSGYTKISGSQNSSVDVSISGVLPAGYLRIGKAF